MIKSTNLRRVCSLSILYLLASCSQPIIETETPWELPVRDAAMIRTITRPIILSRVDTPLHW